MDTSNGGKLICVWFWHRLPMVFVAVSQFPFLAHRLSSGLCVPSCQGLCTVPVPHVRVSINTHTHCTFDPPNPNPLQGFCLCLLFKVMGEATELQHGKRPLSLSLTSLWHCRLVKHWGEMCRLRCDSVFCWWGFWFWGNKRWHGSHSSAFVLIYFWYSLHRNREHKGIKCSSMLV